MYGYSTMMLGYGAAHWIAMLLALVVILYPIGRILGRLGFAPLLAIAAVIPVVNVVALWILAFIQWPNRGGTVTPGGSAP